MLSCKPIRAVAHAHKQRGVQLYLVGKRSKKLFVNRLAVLCKQLGGLLWGRYFSDPAIEVILMVAKLELGVFFGFPSWAVGEDREGVRVPDNQVLVEAVI